MSFTWLSWNAVLPWSVAHSLWIEFSNHYSCLSMMTINPWLGSRVCRESWVLLETESGGLSCVLLLSPLPPRDMLWWFRLRAHTDLGLLRIDIPFENTIFSVLLTWSCSTLTLADVVQLFFGHYEAFSRVWLLGIRIYLQKFVLYHWNSVTHFFFFFLTEDKALSKSGTGGDAERHWEIIK